MENNMIFDIDRRDRNAIAAMEDNGKTLTYGELVDFSTVWAEKIAPRSLIFILTTNTIPSIKGYISSLQAGVVPLLLDGKLDDELLANLLETYKPNDVWVPNSVEKTFGDAVFSDGGYTLYHTNSPQPPMTETLALLLTTSGSTGSPKLVKQSYENIRANTASIIEYLKLDETERPITTLPMSYTYGLSIVNSHVAAGATVLLTSYGIMQREFWTFFKDQGATSFGGVPYTYEMLKRLRFFKMELPTLRTFTQAGGKLLPDLHKEFAEYALSTGRHFVVMYGQTEATARMSYLPWEKALDKYGSMGVAIPGGEFSLIDVAGNEIDEPEVVGELVYKGKNVTLGYAEKLDDLSVGDERGGVLVTGDMAKRDEEGFYYIVGRKKRFLKIFGNRINLDEIERMIKNEFDVECACAGEDDHMLIYIVNAGIKENAEKYISRITGIHFSAFDVRVIDTIPKNEAGKTLYKELP
jgi:acyl-coenzyme A synthetase/AMP-(fatty) acid ligase